ncbi:very short patch repair endonuclease [Desulfobacter postgatei]|uniref:Very short patch repair endonuclease n=1 Tax=Desulfobacter postgatei 2ac9 TaxID=879212 RepID=I5B0H1_9BACT|nr:very short patch repair endonuclease [Desulfobacter postgatei]EIM62984.1 DNA mismatch endonuclease Vsr [Desulfobacter postgatei 2ac9]
MDVFTREKRSQIMSRVSGKNTKPELIVRSLLHNMGYRFRLHRNELPGKPDIILPKYKKIIFVHGCFWHGHIDCPRAKRPTTNKKFWNEKLNKNIERDKVTLNNLKQLGWDVLTVWTCEVKSIEKLRNKLFSFIEGHRENFI